MQMDLFVKNGVLPRTTTTVTHAHAKTTEVHKSTQPLKTRNKKTRNPEKGGGVFCNKDPAIRTSSRQPEARICCGPV